MCPVCTVTVIAGLGISRFFGIDDTVTALWIGGFILSFSFVTIAWINKKWPKLEKGWTSLIWKPAVIILMYLFVLIPLRMNGSVGILQNSLWGIDKIILGVAIGSLVFLSGIWADKKIRKIRGKQLLKFQKVVLPVTSLIIASIVLYLITKY